MGIRSLSPSVPRVPGRIPIIVLAVALVAAIGIAVIPSARADAAFSPAATVVVNEFAASSAESDADSFFELRNVTDQPIDLTGWSVYRCDERGLRENTGRPDVRLRGVILEPGEIFLATQMSARVAPGAVDTRFSQVYPVSGFGLVLVNKDAMPVDAVAMYPNAPWPTQSECAPTPNLPAALSAALDESWQRTDEGDWVRAESTPGDENAQATATRSASMVRIDELAAAGPGGSADDFVELRNTGQEAIDLSGWTLFRCTAEGTMTSDSIQVEFGATRLTGGERLLVAGPAYRGQLVADLRTSTSLADATSGVALIDAEGRRVDGVTLSEHADTACQTGDRKLASALDYRTGESWQRTDTGDFVVAARTPGASNARQATVERNVGGAQDSASILISELATDPVISSLPDGIERSNFVELANFSAESRDVGGWRLYACGRGGFLSTDPIAVIPANTVLAPEGTWVLALAGTRAAGTADATTSSVFDFQGAGVRLEDAAGRRIDGVGVFHVNEMDRSIDTASGCTSGLSLPVFAVDRLRGQSYQRSGHTGDNMTDFSAAVATPHTFAPPAPPELEIRARAVARDLHAEPRRARPAVTVDAASPAGPDTEILEGYAGRTPGGALTTFAGEQERKIGAMNAPALGAEDDGYDFPYVRFAVPVAETPATVTWGGTVLGRDEIRLSVWNPGPASWRTVDSATGSTSALSEATTTTEVNLSGALGEEETQDGIAWLLVQVVPRSKTGLTGDEELADPRTYDFAVTHLTDTQYLSEAYPDVYADMVGWVVGSAQERKIAFATHTGDLVQNWVDPDQPEERARYEFEIASRMQAVLDDAGVPNSVLPGNHDTKRGIDSDLFNEYFGPDRYTDTSWYGGSIGPTDNSANYSTFMAAGARMLMLSLPYAYGDREIAWAGAVVREHPDANVIVSTHEHVTPKTVESPAARSNSSRWVSHADRLWEEVIAPNRNVVVVLSGHFHGLGGIVTENAGGIQGHTVLESLADYQEFRTHTGERATGFARLLQFDLGGGRVGVDALSSTLGRMTSLEYDYEQFRPDDGHESTASGDRPWQIIADGLQNRYTPADDHFTADITLQYRKAVATTAIAVSPAQSELSNRSLR